MENLRINNETKLNYDVLLPEILREEKIKYKGFLAGGVLSAALAALNPLTLIPSAAFMASYVYKNKFDKKTKSKQFFNGARDIYLNSIDNKVALSIALFYANKAIEFDNTNLKAVAIKAFILKAMGNLSEMDVVLETIPDENIEFKEVKDILNALQLEEPQNQEKVNEDVFLTEEEIKNILKEKGFNLSKNFLESIHKNGEEVILNSGKEEVVLTYTECIDNKMEPAIKENLEEVIHYTECDQVENKHEEKELVLLRYIEKLFEQNNINCKLYMQKTGRYCNIIGESRFIKFKFNGKKEYAITPFTVRELKDMGVELQLEVTPKSENGVSRVIFKSMDDITLMDKVIIKCYNNSLK